MGQRRVYARGAPGQGWREDGVRVRCGDPRRRGEERRNDPAAGWLTLVALWVYWMPAQAINFWAVPRHLTIPFMNLPGFGWNASCPP